MLKKNRETGNGIECRLKKWDGTGNGTECRL